MGTEIDPMTLNERELKVYQKGHEDGVQMGLSVAKWVSCVKRVHAKTGKPYQVDSLGEVSRE